MILTLVALLTALSHVPVGVPQAAPQPAPSRTAARTVDPLALQVALDRAGFSPGALDGRIGPSTRKALEAYRAANEGGEPPVAEPTTRYRLTEPDVAGPFEPDIPPDLVE